MRVRFRYPAAGPNFVYDAGQVIDLPRAQAMKLIETDQADPVDPMPAERTDMVARGETTEVKVAPGRRVSSP